MVNKTSKATQQISDQIKHKLVSWCRLGRLVSTKYRYSANYSHIPTTNVNVIRVIYIDYEKKPSRYAGISKESIKIDELIEVRDRGRS